MADKTSPGVIFEPRSNQSSTEGHMGTKSNSAGWSDGMTLDHGGDCYPAVDS